MHVRVPPSVARKKRSALPPKNRSFTDARRILTAPEVSEYLRVSRSTLYRLFQEQQIRAFRVFKRDWRVMVEDLAQWVEKESQVRKSSKQP
jgi:excisionase family DNA binding protein